MIKKFLLASLIVILSACSSEPGYELSDWSKLIDPNFDQAKIVSFYKQKVSKVKEGSKEEKAIYAQMQKALKQAGNNKAVDGKTVKLSGYIVPIDIDGETVNKFLFFPNQAACIHVPASPANQTIFVTTKKDKGVLMEDAYENITVWGTIRLKHTKVANGTASFIINDGITKVRPRL
ncbi:DUF3299 domain-containing protein [Sulfurimonas sp. HSL-1716]|uniref:DUF3299 domain-containing protein n=1 Tax=Hydrocurvibacter sulfurireducens TaxID=3131937 RepID=UPI0031F8E2E2